MKSPKEKASANKDTRTADELCRLTGLSLDRFKSAVKSGHVTGRGGEYPLAPAMLGIIRSLSAELAEAGGMPTYDSIASCAGSTGIPLAVLKKAKKEGCDAFRSSRVYLAKFIRWLWTKGDDKDWDKHFKKYHAMREEIAWRHDNNETLQRQDVEFAIAKGLSMVWSSLDRAGNVELPPLLKGADELKIQSELLRCFDSIKAALKAEWLALSGNGESKT